jgi:TIR domain
MSEIFISYKHEEQATARKLANALESEGWTVWWDPKLRAGEHFDDVIEKALNDAKCVIVMWSERSVQSRYVRDEATYALEKDKFVPVAIENVTLPFRFRGVHTPSLLGWDGSKDFAEFRRLVEDIAEIVASSATKPPKAQPADRQQPISESALEKQESELKPGPGFRDQVFILYHHTDERWLDKLQGMLKPAVRDNIIRIWDDNAPASTWREEKTRAVVAQAKVVVLLVSARFLASDFIAKNWLPPLELAIREGLRILWVCLSDCWWQETKIAMFQAAHDVSRPLRTMRAAQQDAVLVSICEKIKNAVEEP